MCDFTNIFELFILFEFAEATADELRLQREEKKRYLLRKLSFRPSVDELKNRKVNITVFTKVYLGEEFLDLVLQDFLRNR